MSDGLSPREAALRVVRRLREHGHEALWAGGCVRDMLLGHEPADFDVATNAVPDRIVELFGRTRKVGMQFGVVLVGQGPHWIETATFRSDVNYQDGRRPERVVFTTAEHDAERRDFTINGLFYDPIDGHVIDYVGGQRDLAAKIVRAIGDPERRFAEDHLRLLRAVRFETRFNFTLDPATAEAITRHAEQIRRISPERIREELAKMFAHPSRARAMEQLARLGLLNHLWPGADWSPERVARAVSILSALPEPVDFVLSLAAILHDRPRAEVEAIGLALRCSNQQIAEATWLTARHADLNEAATMSLAAFKKLLAHPRFSDLMELHRAVCIAAGLPLYSYEAAVRRRASIPPDEIAPPPLVTGDDLIAMGLRPGPAFKAILDRLYDEQLNVQMTSREDALARARGLITCDAPRGSGRKT
jgi:poly(A) polymerase